MSSTLLFGNSLDKLLEALIESLRDDDFFLPLTIAVPNPSVARWIQLRLAQKMGIAANLNFVYLADLLWKNLDQSAYRRNVTPLGEEELSLHILRELLASPPRELALEYQRAAGSLSSLVELSSRLAKLFLSYELHRPDRSGIPGLIESWSKGKEFFASQIKSDRQKEIASQEDWQKELYQRIFFKTSQVPGSDSARLTLAQAIRTLGFKTPESRQKIHLFAPGHVPQSLRQALYTLGSTDNVEISVYVLNPCSEIWEDFMTEEKGKREVGIKKVGTKELSSWKIFSAAAEQEAQEAHLQIQNLPLALWGRFGRESIQLWCQSFEYDFDSSWQEQFPRTILGSIQAQIFSFTSDDVSSSTPKEQDKSLAFWEAPSVHREVEYLHQHLLNELSVNPELKCEDIAVYVSDMKLYREAFLSVFSAHQRGEDSFIPFTFADLTAKQQSPFFQALKGLFELCEDGFSRSSFLFLAQNPWFQSSLDLNSAILEEWKQWTEDLSVYRGYDADHKARNSWYHSDNFTWKKALQRLSLGMCAAGELDTLLGDEAYPQKRDSESDSYAKFIFAVESLFSDCEKLSNSTNLSQWSQSLSEMCLKWFSPPQSRASEKNPQAKNSLDSWNRETVLNRLKLLEKNELEKWDGISLQVKEVSALGKAWILQDELELPGTSGRFLCGGINICSLLPFRPIPFKQIYVLGLGEGKFPRESKSNSIDLLQFRRWAGDNTSAWMGRYAFLETLISAREKMVLSYVSQDIQQDKDMLPSQIWIEFQEFIQQMTFGDSNQIQERTRKIPIAAWERAGEEGDTLVPGGQSQVLHWLYTKRFQLQSVQKNWSVLAEALLNESRSEIQKEIGSILPPSISKRSNDSLTEQVIDLDAEDLVRFLKNPFEYSLFRRWKIDRLKDETENSFLPLKIGYPGNYQLSQAGLDNLVMQIFFKQKMETSSFEKFSINSLSGSVLSPKKLAHELYRKLAFGTLQPESDFAEQDILSLGETFHSMQTCLEKFSLLLSDAGVNPDLSMESYSSQTIELQIPITNNRRVRIRGKYPFVFPPKLGGQESQTVAFWTTFTSGKFKPEKLLRIWINWLLAQCASQSSNSDTDLEASKHYSAMKLFLLAQGKKSPLEVHFWRDYKADSQEALSYLSRLLCQLIDLKETYYLPLNWIEEALSKNNDTKSKKSGAARCPQWTDELGQLSRTLKQRLKNEKIGANIRDPYSRELNDFMQFEIPDYPANLEEHLEERYKTFFSGFFPENLDG